MQNWEKILRSRDLCDSVCKSMVNIGVNGFGRIGRVAFRLAWGRKGVEIVALNDLASPAYLAHLLKYDSVFRTWNHEVTSDEKHLIVDGKKISVLAEKNPTKLPWGKMNIDVVLECSGRFTLKEQAKAHLVSGAKAVIISAPSDDAPTYLIGVNHKEYTGDDTIVNNASCTTNSVAPVMAVIHEALRVKKAMISTVHSVTAEQNLVDAVPPPLHPDLRRARSALCNIVPTTTGAAQATAKTIKGLEGRFDGIALRVPILDVSLSDLTMLVGTSTSVEAINELFIKAAGSPRWKGIIGISNEPLVSSDFIGNTCSAIIDLAMTRVVDHDLVKVCAWYDNEWGYAARLIDLAEHVGRKIK